MSPADFHFLRPLWLLLLPPLALLLWGLLRSDGEAQVWRRVVDAHLLASLLSGSAGRAQRLPLLLLGAGWLLAVLALAGPTWERLPEPLYQARQFRVVVLDLSPSMNATDLAPSRLARARFEVLDLLRYSGEGQTALLAYGAEPYVVAPLTSDVATIAAQVPNLETGLLPVHGPRRTDWALRAAAELLAQAGATDGQVILITDAAGDAAAAQRAARELAAAGHRVSVLAVGTAEGAAVPLPQGGLLKDASGAVVVPRLEAEALRTLAAAGGGRFVTAAPGDRDIAALLPAAGRGLAPDAERQDARSDRWREEGPWLLLALLPLAALAFRRGWLSPVVLLAVLAPVPETHAAWDDLWLTPDQQASRRLEDGAAGEAAALFERHDWRAAAHYQAGDFAAALEVLRGDGERPQDAYNVGNSLARLGRYAEAIAAYDRALEAQPQDEDARHNRALLERLLEQRERRESADQPPQVEDSQRAQPDEAQDEQQVEQQDQAQPGEQADQQQASQQGEEGQAAQQGEQSEQPEQSEQSEAGEQGEQSEQGGEQQQASQQGAEEQQAQSGEQGQEDEQAQNGDRAQQDRAGQGADQTAQDGQSGEQDEAGRRGEMDEQAAADAGRRAGPQGEEAQAPRAGEQRSDADGEEAQLDAQARQAEQGDQVRADAAGQAADDGQDAPQSAEAEAGDAPQGQDRMMHGEADEQAEARAAADAEAQAGEDAEQRSRTAQTPGDEDHRADGAGTQDDSARDAPGGEQQTAQAPPGRALDPGAARQGAGGGPDVQQPGLADLLGGDPADRTGDAGGSPMARAGGLDLEERQAMEQMLRRVEDDPGGLLRQRFLLQHLRRTGRLP